jgi:valyl-tRNA synthetase
MPFLSEELWSHLPGTREPLLAGARWPDSDGALLDPEAEARFACVQALVTAVRNIRAEYGVAPGQTVRTFVAPATLDASEGFNAEERTIERLAKIAALGRTIPDGGVGAHAILPDGSAVFVPLGDAIDVAKECARLRQELERVDALLSGVAGRLGDARFVSRAPAEVVERERTKEKTWREQRTTLADKLRVLGC